MVSGIDFVVSRDDLHVCKFVRGEDFQHLKSGQVQLRIQKFAMTANNITYAVYGDAIGYWNFFPADQGWGRVPVWGFGEVVESANEAIPPGQRFYGFLPVSALVTMDAKPNSTGFRDVAIHRQQLPGAYNQYLLTTKDPVYDPNHENEQMILRPLFLTSFLAHDFLAEKDFFGARTVILSSASSKTAYGIAFLLSRAGGNIEVVGLTSGRNKDFTRDLGCYNQVVEYDEIDSLHKGTPATYIDVAGSVQVRRAVRDRLSENLVYSMALGDTHWQEEKFQASLAGDQEFFFAPTWLTKRVEDWGMSGYAERFAGAWRQFSELLAGWMKVVEETGQDAVQRVYLEHLDGRADPRVGNVLSLSESPLG